MTSTLDGSPVGMPDSDHVDQSRQRRTDPALARRFEAFAELECAASGSGMSVDSPMYAMLSHHVAESPTLLALARECRVAQPIPNLLFAAVKRLVADAPDSPLADLYECAARGEPPTAALPHAFERFCNAHRDPIITLVRSRGVQTNEVGRCSHLMPAFGIVVRTAERALALIDVGAGAGLNLLWNRFDYRYSDGSVFGSGQSLVRIDCESRGRMPDIPAGFPEIAYRMGLDLHPINLADDNEYRWLQALIWPDHADRITLLANARRVW